MSSLDKARVRHLLREVRSSSGRDSARKAGELLHYVRNVTTGDYVRRNEDPRGSNDGAFMAVKKDGKPFKGVAKEPDKRRQYLDEVRSSKGQDSSRAAGKFLDCVRNAKTADYVKRSESSGKYVVVRKDGKLFKGISTEPDGQRK